MAKIGAIVSTPEELASQIEKPKSLVEQAIKEQSKSNIPLPRIGETGLTVSVVPYSEWRTSIPPAEHWPFAFVDVYTGESLNDVKQLLGRAQVLGTGELSSGPYGKDFVKLQDIAGLHVRLAINPGAPGKCSISVYNDLVEKVWDRSHSSWERRYFKRGRFCDGAKIQYMGNLRNERTGDIWYEGTLHEVRAGTVELFLAAKAAGAADVMLDGRAYKVHWVRGVPHGRIDPHRIFATDMGEPVFDPMMKLKVFAGNRFTPEQLEKFGYRITNGKVPRLRMPGKEVKLSELTDFTGSAAYEFVSNIFTGYISDVRNNYQGGRWTMDIQANDVTCWLDYSQLNVNPSVNAFGRDVMSDAEKQYWQIFTTRFEGMPAHEIIRAIFLGLKRAKVSSATPLFSTYDEKNRSIVLANLPVLTNVYIRGEYPVQDPTDPLRKAQSNKYTAEEGEEPGRNPKPTWYYVVTDEGYVGWVPAEKLREMERGYTGIGNFTIDSDPTFAVHPVVLSNRELSEMFSADKLIINPVLDAYDEAVLKVYTTMWRRSWPLVQSEYATRRSIVAEVCKQTNSELYADGGGRVWFHPIRAYTPVTNPVYVLQPDETISWAVVTSDREIATWAHVTGLFDFDLPLGEWSYDSAFESVDMVKRFGVRGIQLSNPNIRDPASAHAYARSILRKMNANMITGLVTMILRPEIQLGRNVFIPWLNLVGYVSGIDHQIQWGRVATTTLSLKYVRHPWEPWYPIQYKAAESETLLWELYGVKSYSRSAFMNLSSKPQYSSTVRQEQDCYLAAEGNATVKVKGYVLDAYSRAVGVITHPITGDYNPTLTVLNRRAVPYTGYSPYKAGLALDVHVDGMGDITTADPHYEETATACKLYEIMRIFREAGFRVTNKYDLAKNPELGKPKEERPPTGWLKLEYPPLKSDTSTKDNQGTLLEGKGFGDPTGDPLAEWRKFHPREEE